MKERIKHAITVVSFVVILILLYLRISTVISVYNEDDCDRKACLFFELPRNSVDCLLLGSSHVFCSYIPQILFDEYGITSADLATSAQSYQNSYYLLKEALKHQKPKVVLLDINNLLCFSDGGTLSFRLHFTSGISNLPDNSINKLMEFEEMKNMHYGYSERMDFSDAYSFWIYKNEFDRGPVNLANVLSVFVNPVYEYETFGYYPVSDVHPLKEISCGSDDDEGLSLEDTPEFAYLLKILDLLEKNNIDLIMVRSPYYCPDANSRGLYSQGVQFLADRGIPYINYFDLIDEIGIDINTDFYDDDHLNVLGATKATKYLGEYLTTNYSFDDHRGDNEYYLWRDNKFDYENLMNKAKENATSMGFEVK